MDALSSIVNLLKPQAVGAKIIHGAGRWAVRYPAHGQPSFALILKGSCWLQADGMGGMILGAGDFVLFPAMPGFTMASDAKEKPGVMKTVSPGDQLDEVFHGDTAAESSVSMVGGYFSFEPMNAPILLDLLPAILCIRANDPASGGVALIVEHLQREAREKKPGRALVLARLIEVMLVEALRSEQAGAGAAGLLTGLGDARSAAALHAIHARTAEPWTLATLAKEAGMSRSSFAERFLRMVGMTPMNYLLQWRLAVAKDLMTQGGMTVGEAALAVGYESASGFSTAFSRETGKSPKEFTKMR